MAWLIELGTSRISRVAIYLARRIIEILEREPALQAVAIDIPLACWIVCIRGTGSVTVRLGACLDGSGPAASSTLLCGNSYRHRFTGSIRPSD